MIISDRNFKSQFMIHRVFHFSLCANHVIMEPPGSGSLSNHERSSPANMQHALEINLLL